MRQQPQADWPGASNRTPATWSQLSQNITARSSHLGGVHALFRDGRTQFLKDSINVLVWQGLGSRNGGEVISADTY